MLATDTYWRETLAGSEHTPYPPLPPFVEQAEANKVVEYCMKDVHASSFVYAAWALITGRMTDSEDIIFGVPVFETSTLVPLRIRLGQSKTVATYLKTVQQEAANVAQFSSLGLVGISKLSSDCAEACVFQTVLALDKLERNNIEQSSNYGLTIQLEKNGHDFYASALLDPRMVEPQLAFKLLCRLEFVTKQLAIAEPETPLDHLQIIPPRELSLIQEWNSIVPAEVERCIHNIVEEHVLTTPHSPAICAWDGGLTHRQLDELSTNLAHQLIDLGVGPEKVVPLCFEKSMWTVVAMFSVLKAGGAFVLLDPGLPDIRIEKICRQVKAATSITSVSCSARLASSTQHNIALCRETAEALASRTAVITDVNPRNAAYIIFTSGSTGEPKGCVIEHRSYCSAAFGHGKVLGMNSETRALQFGSYNFAGAIMETLMTLMYGGCVCIPSTEERATALAQVIGRLNANWAFLTSTVLALLRPEEVPSLRTICVGGEAIRHSQIKQWAPSVHLRQTYGSAETAAVVASSGLDPSAAVTNVGIPTTAKCWLTHPADINQLVPIGAPGEVVFEGPVIGREYIGNPEKTVEAFTGTPSWRGAFGTPASSSRFYRTGDIAIFRSDGSLELQGRKDTQVKIRGQRVELGEIEHQARLVSSELKEVAVDIATIGGRGSKLVCFMILQARGKSPEHVIATLRHRLQDVLPPYMVPSLFFPMSALPLTVSGKLDRRRLREMGVTMATEQQEKCLSALGGQNTQPTTENERQLHAIWSAVLKMEPKSIGINTSFFQLGGDSVSAMKVVTEARKCGMTLTMKDLFKRDTIAELADQTLAQPPSSSQQSQEDLIDVSSLSALGNVDLADADVDASNVEDIYPLTGVQELLVAATVATSQMVDYFILSLDYHGLDLQKLEGSCIKIIQKLPILRSCWLNLGGQFWQVVLQKIPNAFRKVSVPSETPAACQEFCLNDQHSVLTTHPTAAWILVEHDNGSIKLLLRASHAQYDAFSIPIIFQAVMDDYVGKDTLSQVGFPSYLSYISRQRSKSITHWKEALKGSKFTPLAPHMILSPESLASPPAIVVTQSEAHVPKRPARITPASLVRVAWAAVVARLTGTNDVVFGHVVAGRNADLPEVEKIVGCCLNILPERINFSSSTTAEELLRENQERIFMMGDADTLNCFDLLKECTNWPAEAKYDSILHHRVVDTEPEVRMPGGGVAHVQTLNFPVMPPFLFIVSVSKEDRFSLELFGNTHLVSPEVAQKMIDDLARLVEKLCTSMGMSASAILD
ncbi:hypothetical protein F5Y16DRAFT_419931 [Xylariaceae sp. FL0255]|nr:hypothetical protein F5Y16DRAFT_419931 [Xylariaceae sp. FL0255]